jgi:glutamine phosphoribosylpyrophosphate amidotransferase
MCGLVGAIIRNPSGRDFLLLRSLIVQASIRGRHATGVAWVKNKKVQIEKASLPAKDFLEKFGSLEKLVNEDGNIYCLAHTRYSTSDLKFNQPLGDGRYAIAHNGVVSQEPVNRWKELYGYTCSTKNDSELLLQALRKKHRPLETFPNCSAAVIELHHDKHLRAYRNGKRPLYFSFRDNGVIVTSTVDIGRRSGLKGMVPYKAGQYIKVAADSSARIDWTDDRPIDLQRIEPNNYQSSHLE